jgi:hypothetical protein
MQRLRNKLWRQKNWLLHHDNALPHTSSFTREFLTKTTLLLSLTHPTHLTGPPVTFPFPQFKMKLKGRRFDTTEVMEAESQAVLNTLTEYDFQDAFKKWQKLWEWCICVEGDYIKGDGGQ